MLFIKMPAVNIVEWTSQMEANPCYFNFPQLLFMDEFFTELTQ